MGIASSVAEVSGASGSGARRCGRERSTEPARGVRKRGCRRCPRRPPLRDAARLRTSVRPAPTPFPEAVGPGPYRPVASSGRDGYFSIALTPPGTSPGAPLRSRSPLPFSAPGVYCVRGGAESSPGCRAGADRRWPRCRERFARGLLCPPALSGHRSRAIHRTGLGAIGERSCCRCPLRRPLRDATPASDRSGFLRQGARSSWTGPAPAVCIFGRRRLAFRLL